MTAAALAACSPTQELRAAMLAQLEGCHGLDAALLRLRVRCAVDPVTFWHLRPALMQTVAGERGESAGRGGVRAIDQVFLHHWPDAPVSRPAPLR
jgi:hypothetical protein